MNQYKAVLYWLRNFGGITPAEAYAELGIMRLAAIICKMRKDGYKIRTERISIVNRIGKRVSFARYFLEV